MNKVYVIKYEDLYSDGSYASGVSYAFDTLDKALQMLDVIKEDQIQYYVDAGTRDTKEDVEELIKDLKNGFMIDFIDEYSKFTIRELEVQ